MTNALGYIDLMKLVKRERETEARVRSMDTHEIVAEIHALEDKLAKWREAVDRLQDTFGCDCGDHAREILAEMGA